MDREVEGPLGACIVASAAITTTCRGKSHDELSSPLVRSLLCAAGIHCPLDLPASAADRSRIVSGWALKDRSEQDGGRLITMAKSGRNWKIEHTFNLWHGNGGVYIGATFRWRDCRSGEVEAVFPWDEPITAEVMAGRSRDYMEECGLSPREQRQVAAGLGKTLAQVRRWIADYRRDTRHWME